MLRKNTAGQFVYFAGVNATTGAALTGATFSCRRSLDGTFAASTGSITEDTGLGLYKMALSQADTNGNNCGYFFTATNAVPVCLTVITTALDPTSTAFGLSIAKTTNITGFNDIAAPTGFAAATFPAGTVANTTNITAATGITVATNSDKTGYGLSSAAVQAIWDALTSALTTVGSIGKKLADWTIGTAQTGDSFARLGAPSGASVSADIAAVKAETASIQSDTNDLQTQVGTAGAGLTALATQASVNTIDDFLDTEIAAIKVKTDSLTFTVAGVVDANIQRINDVTIVGDGGATPFNI